MVEELAAMVAWLASEDCSFSTVGVDTAAATIRRSNCEADVVALRVCQTRRYSRSQPVDTMTSRERAVPGGEPATFAASSSTITKRFFRIFDSRSRYAAAQLVEDRGLAAAASRRSPGCRGRPVPCRATWSARSGRPSRRVMRRVGIAFLAGDRGDLTMRHSLVELAGTSPCSR